MARPGTRRSGKAPSTQLLFHISIQRAGPGQRAVTLRATPRTGRASGRLQRGRSYGKSVRFSSRSRPLPAFFLFMAQHRKELQSSNPRWGVVQMAKNLGRMWRRLPRREREMYKEQAKRMKSTRGMRRRGRGMARRQLSKKQQNKNLMICFTTKAETLRRFLMSYL